jgi:hypothetical protein
MLETSRYLSDTISSKVEDVVVDRGDKWSCSLCGQEETDAFTYRTMIDSAHVPGVRYYVVQDLWTCLRPTHVRWCGKIRRKYCSAVHGVNNRNLSKKGLAKAQAGLEAS